MKGGCTGRCRWRGSGELVFKGSCDNTKPKLLGFSDNKGLKDKIQPVREGPVVLR